MLLPPLRVFISSPGDVAEERATARHVIEVLARDYEDVTELRPVFWEDLPLSAHLSFQEGIDLLLSEREKIDVAVFILWGRLGTPLAGICKRDGAPYLSGTEREFELMCEAYERSGRRAPHILVYRRKDEAELWRPMAKLTPEGKIQRFEQWTRVQQFFEERFADAERRNQRAAIPYLDPADFGQKLWKHLHAIIDEMIDSAEVHRPSWNSAPYRGLEVFDVEHAPIFFGREDETNELVERLQQRGSIEGCAFVVIVGESGAGKSSLARAGVAARLLHRNLAPDVRRWRCAVLTLDSSNVQLLAALAEALVAKGALPELRDQVSDLSDLETTLKKPQERDVVGTALKPALGQAARSEGGRVRLLLLLDQLEGLWRAEPPISDGEREEFFRAIDALVHSGEVHVLATLRSDFYADAQRCEAFMRLKAREHANFRSLP